MDFKGILALFGFGNNSLNMIKMFYIDINTSTTKRVNINRASRLPNLLFCIFVSVELLSIMTRLYF